MVVKGSKSQSITNYIATCKRVVQFLGTGKCYAEEDKAWMERWLVCLGRVSHQVGSTRIAVLLAAIVM